MKIITLISDWKYDSYYAASVKGAIYSRCPDVQVIDISHQVDLYKTEQAAHILKHSFRNFPDKTVHIIGVQSDVIGECAWVAVEYHNHYFISADNGIFGLLCDDGSEKAVCLPDDFSNAISFPELNVFVPAAIDLVNNKPFTELGKTKTTLQRHIQMLPLIEERAIIGHVIFIDSYSNVITNITKEIFETTSRGRKFVISILTRRNSITKLNSKYSETSGGELFAIFNASDQLELGISKGKMAKLLNIGLKTTVRVSFG